MKKIKFERKLNLKKEIVSRLNQDQMSGVVGGKLTDKACRTGRLCAITTTDTYCTVSIACVDIDLKTETVVIRTTGATITAGPLTTGA